MASFSLHLTHFIPACWNATLTAKKMKFPIPSKDIFGNVTKFAGTADLVTFAEEILNGKLHFLCSDWAEMG